MNTVRKFRNFIRIAMILTLFLLVFLIGFASIPLEPRNNTLPEVSDQEWISQRIAKDALLLEFSDKEKAISEIQDELPLFEQNQSFLVNLKTNEEISVLIKSTQPDFINIDLAVKNILINQNKQVNSIQVQIILSHERNYFISYANISNILMQQDQNKKLILYVIEAIIVAILMIINIATLIIVEKRVKEYVSIKENI